MRDTRPYLSAVAATVAQNLHVDVLTAHTVRALRECGVEVILLKGASLARSLYEPGARSYSDSDLLVAPDRLETAESRLATLGYSKLLDDSEVPDSLPLHAHVWMRGSHLLDLHRSLWGAQVSPDVVWRVLAGQTEMALIAQVPTRVLNRPAMALHIAMHAAQHGIEVDKPLRDLERALAVFEPQVWLLAADLARRLRAVAAFGTGVRLVPQGSRLANALELPKEQSAQVALSAGSSRPGALALERIATADTISAKYRVAARWIFPSPNYMRVYSQLARQGMVGLFWAYTLRFVSLPSKLGPAFVAWRRARRRV